ncbi:MAG: hypothetical protein ACR2GY_13455 [Phycisphaerales bacterium]
MLRWFFLVAGIGGFILMLAFGSQLAVFLSFGAMFGNFATMCLLSSAPMDRARGRIALQLSQLRSTGDAHQRLSTSKVVPTDAELSARMDTMTILSFASGVACVAFLVWGIVLWVM